MKLSNLMIAMALAAGMTLSGCSAVHTAVAKRNLDVQTKMSQTIWLEPAETKTVYLQIKNTSDKPLNVESKITAALQAKGYTVTQDAKSAQYWIQANVLKVEKMNLRDAESALTGGYGAAGFGAIAGASLMASNSNSGGAAVAAGLAGGLIGVAADAMVEDVNYSMITDIQIGERTDETITTQNNQMLTQGTSGAKVQTSTSQGNRAKYQTRVVSNANKMNLKFEEAEPVLEEQLAKAISGIL